MIPGYIGWSGWSLVYRGIRIIPCYTGWSGGSLLHRVIRMILWYTGWSGWSPGIQGDQDDPLVYRVIRMIPWYTGWSSDNFPNEQFSMRQLLKYVLAAALVPQPVLAAALGLLSLGIQISEWSLVYRVIRMIPLYAGWSVWSRKVIIEPASVQ